MECKTFEVRDSATFMPVLGVRLTPACERDRWLLGRSGFGTTPESQGEYIMLWPMAGGNNRASTDMYEHGNARTMAVAHNFINKNWASLESGALIDVQFILGERETPKESEAVHA